MFFFFFSSRRRHTRCSRDWSSDVCSSDLVLAPPRPRVSRGLGIASGAGQLRHPQNSGSTEVAKTPWALRSEEHTSELQSRLHLVCRLLLEKKINTKIKSSHATCY